MKEVYIGAYYSSKGESTNYLILVYILLRYSLEQRKFLIITFGLINIKSLRGFNITANIPTYCFWLRINNSITSS